MIDFSQDQIKGGKKTENPKKNNTFSNEKIE